jgi:Fe-S-cluster containining protein
MQVITLMDNATHATDLCLVCGLCCQGVVHSHTALDTSELDLARELSLRVDMFEDGLGFHLPCPQYQDDHCTAYQRRPLACVNYQCELLRRFLAGEISLEESLFLIARTKEMVDQLWTRLPGGKATPITFKVLRAIVGKESHTSNEESKPQMNKNRPFA